MANREVDIHFNNDSATDFAERVRLNQQKLIFDARFSRCYPTLHFIACRVLGRPEGAEEVIGSCWRIAYRHPQRFEYEGEFHSWLLRVLIHEALVLLRESVPMPTPKAARTFVTEQGAPTIEDQVDEMAAIRPCDCIPLSKSELEL